MATPRDPDPSTVERDRDGVRIVRTPRRGVRTTTVVGAVAVVAVIATFACWQHDTRAATGDEARPTRAVAHAADATSLDADAQKSPTSRTSARTRNERLPLADSSDLASHFKPGDPEPTGAELIGALHDAGIRTGIGAFNPPGTSPPLHGLAVPPEFVLPEGYVRHHQVTDAGVPLEPILMFAPGFALLDAQGRPRPMPADRVVPPELAPPGLPLRRIRIPAR